MKTAKAASIDLWTFEREARDAGFSVICGVDEAGRGPLAGLCTPRRLSSPTARTSKG